jgi:hypothetical protein
MGAGVFEKGGKEKEKRGSFRIPRKPISLFHLLSHEPDSETFLTLASDDGGARKKSDSFEGR